jgi:hypothetical protein
LTVQSRFVSGVIVALAALGCGVGTASSPRSTAPGSNTVDGGTAQVTGALGGALASPGWAALSPEEQGPLAALVGGTANPWSVAAARAVEAALATPGWDAESAEGQATFFRSLWDDPTVRPRQVSELQLAADLAPARHTLGAPTSIGVGDFSGGQAEASRWDMVIGAQAISIYGPTSGQALGESGTRLLSPEAMANAIAPIPAILRNQIRTVVLNPYRDPRDAQYDLQFGVTGFRAFMEGHPDGVVRVFPQVRERTDVTDVLLHEIGHVWSVRDLTSADWDTWTTAQAADGHFVSLYGSKDPREDLAECSAVYAALSGTPGLAELVAMFPARFALLAGWMPSASN